MNINVQGGDLKHFSKCSSNRLQDVFNYYWVPGIVPGSRFCHLILLFKQSCN